MWCGTHTHTHTSQWCGFNRLRHSPSEKISLIADGNYACYPFNSAIFHPKKKNEGEDSRTFANRSYCDMTIFQPSYILGFSANPIDAVLVWKPHRKQQLRRNIGRSPILASLRDVCEAQKRQNRIVHEKTSNVTALRGHNIWNGRLESLICCWTVMNCRQLT